MDSTYIPFYDLETAARVLAEIVIKYDLVEALTDATAPGDASIADTAAHDILAHLKEVES